MKKKVKKIFAAFGLFVIIWSFFLLSSSALEKDNSLNSEKKIEQIFEDFSSVIPDESEMTIEDGSIVTDIGVEGILNEIISSVKGKSSEYFSFFLAVFGFAVISVVAELASFSTASMQRACGVGVFVIMSVSLYPRMYELFSTVKESLSSLSTFFGSALPILTAITTASGAVETAGVQAMNMNITLGVVGSMAVNLLLPLSFALLGLSLVFSFGESGALSVVKGIKNTFTFGLGIVTAISSAAIAMQTVVASAQDSAALRAARYATGGLIPIVGSSVSSALSTLAGGVAYAKSTVGAGAIFVMLSLAVGPLISLIFYRLAFSVSIFLLEFLDIPRGVRCFSAYRTAIDAVISVYVMSTLVCIIQVIVFMKGGVGSF